MKSDVNRSFDFWIGIFFFGGGGRVKVAIILCALVITTVSNLFLTKLTADQLKPHQATECLVRYVCFTGVPRYVGT